MVCPVTTETPRARRYAAYTRLLPKIGRLQQKKWMTSGVKIPSLSARVAHIEAHSTLRRRPIEMTTIARVTSTPRVAVSATAITDDAGLETRAARVAVAETATRGVDVTRAMVAISIGLRRVRAVRSEAGRLERIAWNLQFQRVRPIFG